MDAAPTPTRLGEYLLKECLSEGPLTRRWLAEQESVRRTVLIDELRPERMDQAEVFLADVRAKAAVDHPSIGTVYEAISGDGVCYCAHELLPGATLADRLRAAEPLKPLRVAYFLRRIAEANPVHESRGPRTEAFGPAARHVDAAGAIRLGNLVVGDKRAADQSTRDVIHLGEQLPALVADGLPGATRVLTLLGWMRRGQDGRSLTWREVYGYCEQIEQQLADLMPAMTPMTAAVVRPKKPPVVAITAGVLALILLGFFTLQVAGRKSRPLPRPDLPKALVIAAGEHPTPDGGREPLRQFRISSHEVTIGEYRAFLEALELHAKNGRGRIYDHENQPDTKADHLPADWLSLLDAARTRGTWQNREVSLDSPVVGVDWWDAVAYAEWKQGRLPTQEEWFAALRQGGDEPAKLAPGPWQPVTIETPDRTRLGLLGMAGSVAEWTRRSAVPPDNPAGRPKWVIIGGSYLKQTNGALTREWVDDRSLRRPDLGFRLAFEH